MLVAAPSEHVNDEGAMLGRFPGGRHGDSATQGAQPWPLAPEAALRRERSP